MGYIIFALWVWIGVYTISYGIFEWKSKNTVGAISVWVLALLGGVSAVKCFFHLL